MTHREQAERAYGALCEVGRPDIEIGESVDGRPACRVRVDANQTRYPTEAEFLLVQRAWNVVGLEIEPLPYVEALAQPGEFLAGPKR